MLKTNNCSGGGKSDKRQKIKSLIKSNLISFGITSLIIIGITASAIGIGLNAQNVKYRKNNQDKSLKEVVDDLYEKAEECGKIIGCPGCIQLEYLESIEGAYINTGIKGKTGIEIDTTVLFNQIANEGSVIGTIRGNDRIYPFYIYHSQFGVGYGEYYESGVGLQPKTKYSVYSKLYNGEQIMKVNEQTILSQSINGNIDTNLDLYVFGKNNNGSFVYPAPARIYDLKIKYNDDLVRDYIPVLDNNGEPCLFDRVSKDCFYNQGTGFFEYNTINSIIYKDSNNNQYKQLLYLESTGTQYIDTGIRAKSGIEMDTTVLFNQIPSDGSVVAARNGNDRLYSFHVYPGQFTIGYGQWYSSGVNVQTNTKYSIYSKLYNGEQILKINDQTKLSKNIDIDIDTNLDLYVFGMNYNGSLAYSTPVKIYDLKIQDNGTLVRDYVPVLDSNDRPCLFDKVSKTCFYNQGTGEFLHG